MKVETHAILQNIHAKVHIPSSHTTNTGSFALDVGKLEQSWTMKPMDQR